MEVGKVRNFVFLAQSGAGKTQLAEAMLFLAGVTKRLGKVDEATSILDYEPEEQKRKITISTAVHHLDWKKHQLFLLDTPGEDNFQAEARLAARVADNAVFVIDATDPVKVQAEKAFALVKEFGLPCVLFVNKMDRERADFDKALEAAGNTFGVRTVPVALPIGKEAGFKGIVDLISYKALVYPDDESGKFQVVDIPGDLKDRAEELRANLIEFAAESDDVLLEKFLEGEDLTAEEIAAGLKAGITSGAFVPVCCGSALRNIGLQLLLDLLVSFMASPEDRGLLKGKNPASGQEEERPPSPEAPISAFVFKTTIDPYAGRLSLARIYSGVLRPDGTLLNANKDFQERYSNVFIPEGKGQKQVSQAGPGMIIALAKLSETRTGHTLCDPKAPIIYPMPEMPYPVITYAVHPKTRQDEEKIAGALSKLQEEDPTIQVSRDEETRELLLSGLGQIHIEATVEKLKRKYGVDVDLSLPKIPFRETIKSAKKGVIYRHKKQTGGRGQFAEVHFDISPLPRGEGFEFEEALVGMNVPRNFVPAVEKGIREAMERGPLAGFPVVDVKVRFYDGKSHEVDSSEMAFKIAAIMCFKKGVSEANPVILEPIMELEITVPDAYMGDVIGDLNARRGRVLGMDAKDGCQVIKAQVPLMEVQKYALDLNAITGGRGRFTMRFSHYEEVPPTLAEKIIAAAKEEQEKEKK
ncbi:elongation factor G [Thermosulfuriphilus sp.]